MHFLAYRVYGGVLDGAARLRVAQRELDRSATARRRLTALGEGVLHPSLAAWIGDATPPELRGVVMGGYATANDLGGATGPIVGYAVAAALGFAWAYGLCVALMATALAVLAIGQPGRGSGVPPSWPSGLALTSY